LGGERDVFGRFAPKLFLQRRQQKTLQSSRQIKPAQGVWDLTFAFNSEDGGTGALADAAWKESQTIGPIWAFSIVGKLVELPPFKKLPSQLPARKVSTLAG